MTTTTTSGQLLLLINTSLREAALVAQYTNVLGIALAHVLMLQDLKQIFPTMPLHVKRIGR